MQMVGVGDCCMRADAGLGIEYRRKSVEEHGAMMRVYSVAVVVYCGAKVC